MTVCVEMTSLLCKEMDDGRKYSDPNNYIILKRIFNKPSQIGKHFDVKYSCFVNTHKNKHLILPQLNHLKYGHTPTHAATHPRCLALC